MEIEEDRIRAAQWIFERQLGWIATADVKVGVVIAIQAAMVGGLAAAYSAAAMKSEWALVCVIGSFVCAIGAFVCAANALLPRTNGPASLIFFGHVSQIESANYIERLRTATDAELLDDLAAQIHRNAEIANEKHAWVKSAMIWSFLSAPPWVFAILTLVPQQVVI